MDVDHDLRGDLAMAPPTERAQGAPAGDDIVEPYWLGAVPVTNAQYAAFDSEKPFSKWSGIEEAELSFHPRTNVTWYEAVSFCRWLATLPGFADTQPRLPVEEEWEVACRAGTSSRFWRGDRDEDLDAVGWFNGNAGGRTHRVGAKPANDLGFYDMHGNVLEWTVMTTTDAHMTSDQKVVSTACAHMTFG